MSNLDYEQLWAYREKTLEEFISKYDDPFAGVCAFKRFEADKLLESDGKYLTLGVEEKNSFPHGRPVLKHMPILDKYVFVPYFKDYAEFLLDFVDHNPVDAIVELGSGMATNLIEMFYRGGPRNIPYYAGEYTESGTRIAKSLSKHCPKMDLHSFRFDYNAPNLDIVKEKGTVLFFTIHSIEQVQDVSQVLFETIANHAENVICIHLEPFGWQLEGFDGPPSREQAELCIKNGWNRNLFAALRSAQEAGTIEQTFIAKNVMGGGLGNPTSISIWHN